jgi:SAM-dependent methyltransferase
MHDASGTWHYGLVARWWAEFTSPDAREVDYYAAAIRRFGEPALDLGCGNGRILTALLAQGLDVDGVDISADMIELAGRAAAALDPAPAHQPALVAQATHELDLPRTYRTIYLCGVFGIGGRRDRDREGLHRALRHLEPGGALLINHSLPYDGLSAEAWARWLPGHRDGVPRAWSDDGERKRTADGDEIELETRLLALDPIAQRHTLQMRARLWRDDVLVTEETSQLGESLVFVPEILWLLEDAGFRDVVVEGGDGGYGGRPVEADDPVVMFVARKPG